jgi:hypothetical protein
MTREQVIELMNKHHESQLYIIKPIGSDLPYRYKGKYYNLYEMQDKLVEKGYGIVKGMDELEFSQYLYDLQNGDLKCDGKTISPIPGLEEKYCLQYRGGEIEKTIHAKNEKEALALVCKYNHHPEYWEIVEE